MPHYIYNRRDKLWLDLLATPGGFVSLAPIDIQAQIQAGDKSQKRALGTVLFAATAGIESYHILRLSSLGDFDNSLVLSLREERHQHLCLRYGEEYREIAAMARRLSQREEQYAINRNMDDRLWETLYPDDEFVENTHPDASYTTENGVFVKYILLNNNEAVLMKTAGANVIDLHEYRGIDLPDL
jgi:hypothetical protein